MRHKWLPAALAMSLLCAGLPAAHADGEVPQIISVGLFYGKTALDGANLMNEVGSGYLFGYYDADRQFQQLGYTDVKGISVVKAQNVYYGTYDNYNSYFDNIQSDIAVGCYHVKLPLEPASYEEAVSMAQSVGGFPAWIKGSYQVRAGAYETEAEAVAAADLYQDSYPGASVVGTSAYGVNVVKTGTAAVLFQFDGGEELSLTVSPGLDRSVKPVTWFKGYQYYGDFQYRRVGGGDLVVSNFLPLEEYINCVISREMSASWPLEALKAQAVCARTYYEINLGRHNSQGFDICPTTHCQAYYGMGATNENTARAAQETAGKKAWYNGEPAQTFYFSSDGGATENVRNVWNGGEQIPYLCGVVDPYEALIKDKISGYEWSVTYTGTELSELLRTWGYAASEIIDIKTELSPTGNMKKLTFIDSNGKTWPFVSEKYLRNMLDLRSIHYTVAHTGAATESRQYYVSGGGSLSSMDGIYAMGSDGTAGLVDAAPYAVTGNGLQALEPSTENTTAVPGGDFVFNGAGWGHNVGMSQWGAHAMALQGMTYDQILTFYYPGIELY